MNRYNATKYNIVKNMKCLKFLKKIFCFSNLGLDFPYIFQKD
jgi:hypothetical protein